MTREEQRAMRELAMRQRISKRSSKPAWKGPQAVVGTEEIASRPTPNAYFENDNHLRIGPASNEIKIKKKFVPSKIPSCPYSGHTFFTMLKEMHTGIPIIVKCPECGREVRVRLSDPGTFTREFSQSNPAERVQVHVTFHRMRTKPRSEKFTFN
jgi:hypothetical protein